MKQGFKSPVSELLRVSEGFSVADFDPASTPGFPGDENASEALLAAMGERVADLQERLFAQGRQGGTQSVLLVLQGMDTSGKGGIVRHVIGAVDPQGVRHRSFGVPTEQERRHHYLWRIRNALPASGQIGVFDRSHYEDVLVVRVNNLVEGEPWPKRYAEINRFEAGIVQAGTKVIKCALFVSPEEQLRRLAERLDRPDKFWKYNPKDLDERAKWPAYMDAYQAALDATSTQTAPWYAIPADNKWYARLAIMGLLLETLESLNLEWPPAAFDVDAEKARIGALISAQGETATKPRSASDDQAGKKAKPAKKLSGKDQQHAGASSPKKPKKSKKPAKKAKK